MYEIYISANEFDPTLISVSVIMKLLSHIIGHIEMRELLRSKLHEENQNITIIKE